jgi:hypothetical protein
MHSSVERRLNCSMSRLPAPAEAAFTEAAAGAVVFVVAEVAASMEAEEEDIDETVFQ